jgi:hypothetical protein
MDVRGQLAIAVVCAGVWWLSACGGDEPSDGGGGRNGGGSGTGASGTTGTGGDPSLGSGNPGMGTGTDGGVVAMPCQLTSECGTGAVCVAGRCCVSTHACGDTCCGADDACSFGRCVPPGKACKSAADCDKSEFCQLLISGDEPPQENAPAPTCLDEAKGKCLPLPPICEGKPTDDPDCLDRCEFRPPTGNLDAVVKWQWGKEAAPAEFPMFADVWATPTVARLHPDPCEAPSVVFVSGDVASMAVNCTGPVCTNGVLRALDGRTGLERWSLREASMGETFAAGISVALGDVDRDGTIEAFAMTKSGKLAMVSADGALLSQSATGLGGATDTSYGWGGALAIGDMEGDGKVEVAYGSLVFTIDGGTITQRFAGTMGKGGPDMAVHRISYFADVNADGLAELVAGNTAYKPDGVALWTTPMVPDGWTAMADFDGDGVPEIAHVAAGNMRILAGPTGALLVGPTVIPGGGTGGPPTIADFDGDGAPEIGVAMQAKYSVYDVDIAAKALTVLWSATNHDLSSSVTGSSVFDFEGDGKAEVVYNDECFLWIYDGATGDVRLTALTTSFTATEASIVADVDDDGHAEIVVISNGINPNMDGWKCNIAPWNAPDAMTGRIAWVPSPSGGSYRGITVYADREASWVGTRTLWNQHAYSVTNICAGDEDTCDMPTDYGTIPGPAKANWSLSWLNNFRQNVQREALFDAPDAIVSLVVLCDGTVEVVLENGGLGTLPPGVTIEIVRTDGKDEEKLGSVVSMGGLLPGQRVSLPFDIGEAIDGNPTMIARIVVDEMNRTFNECREDNNESVEVKALCGPE